MVRRKLAQKDHYGQLLPDFGAQEQMNEDLDHQMERIKKLRFLNSFDYICLFCLALVGSFYHLSYFDTVNWHLSAVGRIILIKLLPIYDWRHMKNKLCLIENTPTEISGSFFTCDSCEIVRKIDVYDNLEEDILDQRYIDLDVPVVLTSVLEHWPNNSSFLNNLLSDYDFSSSFPCKLSSNIIKDIVTTGEIMIKARHFDQFFLHFQNCEQDAMRILRRFTFRPTILPATYSPSTYNWLIWNKNYNTTGYKSIDLMEKLTIFGQITGSTSMKLIPRNSCVNVCSTLYFQLLQGELLIFTSLWDLEYKCNDKGENVAVIMEIRD